MNQYLIFLGGIISGTILYLTRENLREQKNKKSKNFTTVQSRIEDLNQVSFQNVAPSNEIVISEISYNPRINGDFLTDDVLDEKFKSIATYYLELIESKNSQEDLYKIRYEKIYHLIESINLYEPKKESREDKKLIIQYLKKVNKPIQTISYRKLLELERDYLFPIIDNKDKYGWKFKNAWILGLVPTIVLEILFWFIINLILSSFTNIQFYYIPIFTTYYLINRLLIQHRKRIQGKIW
jgi:hypothetical protein